MERINVRSSGEWRAFDRLIVILGILLFIILLLLWVFNSKLLPFGCCSEQETVPQEVVVAPPEAPPARLVPAEVIEPQPTPAPAPIPTEAPELGLSIADGRVVVTGKLDSEMTRDFLISEVQRGFPDSEVVDRLQVSTDVRVPLGQTGVAAFLANLNPNDRVSVAWTRDNVRISGVVESDARRVALANSLTDNLFTQGLYNPINLVNQLEVAQVGPSCSDILSAAEIEFARGSAELTNTGRIELSKLIPCLQADRYTIVGHTDSDGGDVANRVLSQDRANAALTYLTTKGLDVNRFTTLGVGEEQPIADNTTNEGKARNRRIEFRSQ